METKDIITAWITKYALTEGIFKIEAEVDHDISPDMITNTENSLQHFHGKDWHRTPEDALARAEVMRTKKLDAIEKQAKKIRAMKFTA